MSSDVRSVHSLPDNAVAQLDSDCNTKKRDEHNTGQHLRVLRLRGGYLKCSFSFVGCSLELPGLSMIMIGLEGGKGQSCGGRLFCPLVNLEGDSPLDDNREEEVEGQIPRNDDP